MQGKTQAQGLAPVLSTNWVARQSIQERDANLRTNQLVQINGIAVPVSDIDSPSGAKLEAPGGRLHLKLPA